LSCITPPATSSILDALVVAFASVFHLVRGSLG
jgi:hypothetical protein